LFLKKEHDERINIREIERELRKKKKRKKTLKDKVTSIFLKDEDEV